jgi:hypothetical protein
LRDATARSTFRAVFIITTVIPSQFEEAVDQSGAKDVSGVPDKAISAKAKELINKPFPLPLSPIQISPILQTNRYYAGASHVTASV